MLHIYHDCNLLIPSLAGMMAVANLVPHPPGRVYIRRLSSWNSSSTTAINGAIITTEIAQRSTNSIKPLGTSWPSPISVSTSENSLQALVPTRPIVQNSSPSRPTATTATLSSPLNAATNSDGRDTFSVFGGGGEADPNFVNGRPVNEDPGNPGGFGLWLIVGVGVAGAVFLAGLGLWWWWRRGRRSLREHTTRRTMGEKETVTMGETMDGELVSIGSCETAVGNKEGGQGWGVPGSS